jgi:hypothetical protein
MQLQFLVIGSRNQSIVGVVIGRGGSSIILLWSVHSSRRGSPLLFTREVDVLGEQPSKNLNSQMMLYLYVPFQKHLVTPTLKISIVQAFSAERC